MRLAVVTASLAALVAAAPGPVTTVREGESYIVELDCVGCHDQNNVEGQSLMLNFTLAPSAQSVLLNGAPIAPLAPLPLTIHAIQTPSLQNHNALDSNLNLADPSLSSVNLAYSHSILGTQQRGKHWIQFDVTSIHSATQTQHLTSPTQPLVELLVVESFATRTLHIETLQLASRANRRKPFQMKCGRLAIATTSFDPAEWDRYGKFGSASRIWNLFWESATRVFLGPGLVLMVVTVVVGVVKVVKRRAERKRSEGEWAGREDEGEDVEAALLLGEDGFFEEEKDDEDEEKA
ncbi:hypothetical protein DM02DRAFT_611027 [Periconia macrospinosa]|uniref:Cytochrome c domain-containing protein n=1 Tax=Periconia macrospinosa TaxID=97972 RepID=A0A2V1E6K6_9PLEO|nr:hypothetical protein DM02DRAFT_611027 [Periconia macrospinosa]